MEIRHNANDVRCLAIARSHALQGNTRNALALFSRAYDTAPQAYPADSSTSADSDQLPKLDVAPEQIKALQHTMQGLVAQYRALVELDSLSSDALKVDRTKGGAAPLVERLYEYPPHSTDLTNLVTYPLRMKPVPVKPIFLDVAWNYIDYPGRTKPLPKVEINGGHAGSKDTSEPKAEGRKGWFGFGR